MKQMTDFQRFIKANKLKQKQVADYLETSPQYINQVVKGLCDLSDEKYERLVQAGWDVSMLNIPPYIKVPATMTVYGTAIEEVEDVSASGIDMSLFPAEKVEEIREEIKAEVIEEVKAEVVEESVVPIVPSEIASKSETNIKKYLEENADELEHFDPRSVTASVNGAERVCSNSMYPTFIPYDVVFIRFLKDKTRITDGGIYYFDSKTRPTMIRMVKIEGNKLRLVAENPRFGDIITDFDDITNIAEIKGMYREQFSGQNVEIEQERRHKDAQITTLIEQNGEALNIIKDLIKKG